MANIEDAIKAINPDAEFVSSPADNADAITWLHGTTPISKADLEAKKAELTAAEEAAVIQKAADKSTGNQKLLDLGLSQAEVDALTK